MGRAKALLPYRGRPFLAHLLWTSRELGLDPHVVVLGPDADKIFASMDLSAATVVRNPDPATGPLRSLKLALEVLNHTVEGVLVWHVDRPHVLLRTIEALLEAAREGSHPIVVPSYRGRRGHPVVFMRAVLAELLETPDDLGARAVVRADPGRVLVVDVGDPAVLEDVNTPEDYRALDDA
jgi:CTP:molybdopterin cytidylyltransferase MocA